MIELRSHSIRGAASVGRPFVDAVIEPGASFASPEIVARHQWLSREEKRLILISWARDTLQAVRDGGPEMQFREAVLEQLALFDAAAADEFEGAFAAAERAGKPSEVAAH